MVQKLYKGFIIKKLWHGIYRKVSMEEAKNKKTISLVWLIYFVEWRCFKFFAISFNDSAGNSNNKSGFDT